MERKEKISKPNWQKINAGWPVEFYDMMDPKLALERFHLFITLEEPFKPNFKRYLRGIGVDTSGKSSILTGFLTRADIYRLSQRPWVIQLTPARRLKLVAPRP